MIRQIKITKFGKFSGENFPFGDVTVFLGANEAGKTTLFDALLYTLCRPPANKKPGKDLKARYGDEMEATLAPPRKKAVFDPDEFLNLYAIRSGDIEFELGDNSAWMERVKARLFSGGIDPAKLCETFANKASTKGTLKHNKQHKTLVEENIRHKEKLAALRQKRLRFLEREQSAARNREQLDNLRMKLAEGKRELEQIRSRLEELKKVRQMDKFRKIQGAMEQSRKRRAQLQDMQGFKQNRSAELDKIRQTCDELSRKLDLAGDNRRNRSRDLAELENRLLEFEQKRKKRQILAGQAGEYVQRMNSFSNQAPLKKTITWHKGLLLSAALPFLGGMAGSFLPGNGLFRLLIPLCGGLLTILLVILARKTSFEKDTEAELHFMEQVKDEWRNRGNPPLQSTTFQGLVTEFQEHQRQADFMAGRVEEYETDKKKKQQTLSILEQEIRELKNNLEKENGNLTRWFQEQGVRNRDEYLRKISEYSELRDRENLWQSELRETMQNYHHKTQDTFAAYLRDRIRELEAELPPGMEATETEINGLEQDMTRRSRSMETLQQQYGKLTESTATETGKLTASLGSLAGEIADLDNRIEQNMRKIARLDQQRHAAGIALDIFSELARDTEMIMVQLGQDLASQFGKIVPELREVEVNALNTAELMIQDKGGVKRNIKHLSRGTRDSFLLAARLALAAGAGEGEGILILDEPFHSLDSARVTTSLAMLKEFRKNTGWQIILFTKEESLAEAIEAVMEGTLVHRLSPEETGEKDIKQIRRTGKPGQTHRRRQPVTTLETE